MTVTKTYTAINGISAVGVKQIIRATALRTSDYLMVNTFDMKVINNQFVYQHPNYTYDNCDTLIVEYTKTTD